MNDSAKGNKEIATSMENPDLDDRPIILKIANIDPAKHARKNSIKDFDPRELKEIEVKDESPIRKTHKIYKKSWWHSIDISIKPWHLFILILLLVITFFAFEVYNALRLKADVTPVCIGREVRVDGAGNIVSFDGTTDTEAIKC